ncbi:Uncharacterized protein TCM_041980 [Theobroma cacao]|uniref:Secreted protein n=1 Tax=Theobroma cacao TaxID=3641 RepID=A0A061GXR1_THECC|nr:Uncharacterized protein TCM_041980 [Theobroma cacao]
MLRLFFFFWLIYHVSLETELNLIFQLKTCLNINPISFKGRIIMVDGDFHLTASSNGPVKGALWRSMETLIALHRHWTSQFRVHSGGWEIDLTALHHYWAGRSRVHCSGLKLSPHCIPFGPIN